MCRRLSACWCSYWINGLPGECSRVGLTTVCSATAPSGCPTGWKALLRHLRRPSCQHGPMRLERACTPHHQQVFLRITDVDHHQPAIAASEWSHMGWMFPNHPATAARAPAPGDLPARPLLPLAEQLLPAGCKRFSPGPAAVLGSPVSGPAGGWGPGVLWRHPLAPGDRLTTSPGLVNPPHPQGPPPRGPKPPHGAGPATPAATSRATNPWGGSLTFGEGWHKTTAPRTSPFGRHGFGPRPDRTHRAHSACCVPSVGATSAPSRRDLVKAFQALPRDSIFRLLRPLARSRVLFQTLPATPMPNALSVGPQRKTSPQPRARTVELVDVAPGLNARNFLLPPGQGRGG